MIEKLVFIIICLESLVIIKLSVFFFSNYIISFFYFNFFLVVVLLVTAFLILNNFNFKKKYIYIYIYNSNIFISSNFFEINKIKEFLKERIF